MNFPSLVNNTVSHWIESTLGKMSLAQLSATVRPLYGNTDSGLRFVEQRNVGTGQVCKLRGLRGQEYGHLLGELV